MSIATTEEQRAIQESIAAWADRALPVRTVRSEEPGGWRRHWNELADLGLFAVAVQEKHGGAGGTVLDLAVMLEASSGRGVPGPILGTTVAALLLQRATGHDSLLEQLISGAVPFAVAPPQTPGLTVDSGIDGLRINGQIEQIPGAGGGVGLIVPAGEDWWVLGPDADGVEFEPLPGIDHGTPPATVRLRDVAVTAAQLLTGVTTGLVELLTLTLAAAQAAGIAGWTVDAAAGYARVREQFGRPIGSFQAVKHLCAHMLCRAEQSRALAWDAANAVGDSAVGDGAGGSLEQATLAAAAAAALVFDAAVDNAKDCIQVHGGIGFTWEHDAHLYLRSAVTLRSLIGGSGRWRNRTAAIAGRGVRRQLTVDLGGFEALRPQLRAEIEQIAALSGPDRRTALVAAGLIAPHWPKPHGRAADPAEQILIDQECERAALSRPDLVIGWWAVPPILQAGTPEQIERFVGPTLRGELAWCQLFSEPGAGSDLASLQMRAVRADCGWRLTGQKVWNSLAAQADRGICLARTDREAPKHHGITFFVVDMATPGITVRPLREITGNSLFNEVFFDDVFVPDDAVIGRPGDGWRLARTTLANERVQMSGGATLGKELDLLLSLPQDSFDPADLASVGELVAQAMSVALLAHRAVLASIAGAGPGAESSVQKLVGVRNRQAAAEFLLTRTGPSAMLEGDVSRMFLNSRQLSIAGGSEQILLTLAGERILGLPR
ncbi:acyl-CoA dehydrogenase [Nakamurella lactea]|uniref:acyl-CoA dehydrogenase n=1 Tax=Nakamurella lactea TaxID=459515 RepID=UPI0003FD2810|nr:acyl-CoA dehydrogenase [Nakamurella lactea]